MEKTFQFFAETSDAGKRLDRFLHEKIGAVSRMFLDDFVRQNRCFVNGEPQPAGYHLREKDRVEIALDISAETAMTPQNLPLSILYEDAEILVVNKPAGMLVHPTKSIKTGTLANALAFHLNFSAEKQTIVENQSPKIEDRIIRPGIVHRLDKETSGLMVVAKTTRALRILSKHFERKLVEKSYLALVEGAFAENEGTINAPIGRIENEKPHWRVLETGKQAETRFRVLERRADAALLELEPMTGRTNQLRIHCAHIGHPIVGDAWYNGREFSRLCLHAARLAFFHPDGGWLEFTSEIPEEFI
jgi:23S rRNA pseudouridine1911/1915/1917 synthase